MHLKMRVTEINLQHFYEVVQFGGETGEQKMKLFLGGPNISFEFNISSMTLKPSITQLTYSDGLTRKGTIMAQLFLTSTPDISLNSSSIQPEYGMSVPFAALNSISTPCPTSSSVFLSLIPGNCSATHRFGNTRSSMRDKFVTKP